jgi:hypothetical protein
VIHVVASDVGVDWILERPPPAETELLCLSKERILGWCTMNDLAQARHDRVASVGDMALNRCDVAVGQGASGAVAIVRCGHSALVVDGERLSFQPNAPSHQQQQQQQQQQSQQQQREFRGFNITADAMLARTLLWTGPVGPTSPVQVTRGCHYVAQVTPTSRVSCGWWCTVPPPPIPCPNRRLPAHNFL